jgi:hypothetical protein
MREKGLEPLSLAALDPKSSVSASFTTLAWNIVEIDEKVNRPGRRAPTVSMSGVRRFRRFSFTVSNEPWRDRTSDPQIKSLLLYQLS